MYPVHFVARKKKLHHLYYSNFMLNALLNTRCNDAQNLRNNLSLTLIFDTLIKTLHI